MVKGHLDTNHIIANFQPAENGKNLEKFYHAVKGKVPEV